MRRSLATLVIGPLVVWVAALSPAAAQPSSPSGEPAASAQQGPAPTSMNSSDDEGGNRTTPGGAGAEGNAPGDRSTGTSAPRALGLLAILAVVCLGAVVLIRRRSRRADEQLRA